MPTLGEKIKQLRGDVSRDGFASRYGIHANTLARYESGERTPDLDFVKRLALDFQTTVDWLLSDEAEAGGVAKTPDRVTVDSDYVMIPLVQARLSAGGGSFEVGDGIKGQYAFRAEWANRHGQPSAMVLMTVSGDSMEPELRDGDLALVDQSQTAVIAGRIYAVGIGDSVVVKVLDVLPGQLLLRSLNPVYQPVSVDLRGDLADGVRVIGRVIWWCREAR